MRFLREALQRSRRIMQIRDILLLLLRTAAVVLFGFALARPYFAARSEQLDAGQAIHAVLLIDNSLSMGYQTLAGTLLDEAKARAAMFIDRLPVGSRISVVPVCGPEGGYSLEPYDTKPFALEAVQRIDVVDRSFTVRQAVNEARRAAESATDLAKRYVLISDQQRSNWADLPWLAKDTDLPPLQVVQVSAEERENTWVSNLHIQDGVADAETPTTIRAEVRHRGREPRGEVRVALSVKGEEVDSQIITLNAPNATRQVTFEYMFREFQPEPSRPAFVPIRISLSPDRLIQDDQLHLLAPVVAVLPVVFVDQFGEDDENPAENRLGETRHLRHLLAPSLSRSDDSRRLVQVRHRRMEQLDRDILADARLVVIAGVANPADTVELLREYVEQGGQLVVAAGAEFDAASWNAAAWLDGSGILPLPLLAEPLGTLPDAAREILKPFYLSYESLGHHPYFDLAGNSEEDLRDLYAEPFFFKAIQVDLRQDVMDALRKATLDQLVRRAPGTRPDESKSAQTTATPFWLLWSPPGREVLSASLAAAETTQRDMELLANEFQPRVLARFTNETGPPFLIDRRMGHGRVLLVTSGLLSSWNTLPKTNAIVMFDRILRDMIQATLPQRNYGPVERIAVPIPDEARDARILLTRPGPDPVEESLDTGFLRQDQVGVTIERPLARGLYRLRAETPRSDMPGAAETPIRWQFDVAVNGDSDESELEPLERAVFDEQSATSGMRWVGVDEDISLAGSRIHGQDMWWWCALIVLTLLLVELMVLAWPTWRALSLERQTAQGRRSGRSEFQMEGFQKGGVQRRGFCSPPTLCRWTSDWQLTGQAESPAPHRPCVGGSSD